MTAGRSPGPGDRTAPGGRRRFPPRSRRLLVGLVVGGAGWGVAALLSPEDGASRQVPAGVVLAVGVALVLYLLDPAPFAHIPDTRADEGRAADSADGCAEGGPEPVRTRSSAILRTAAEPRHVASRARTHAHDGRGEDLAETVAEILSPVPSLLRTFVRLEMTRVIGHLADLSHLSTDCPGENHDWMITLTRAAERSVYAITTSVDREFWNSEPAGRYLDAQQEAIDGRGVRVRRLFLLESARELDDRLLRLCEEQELRRIDVRAAVLPELPPHLQRGTTDDFVLYDEEVSFEIEQDLRDVNVRTRLTARQDHVRDRLRRFRELWDAGMGLRELEVRVDAEEDGNWIVDRD